MSRRCKPDRWRVHRKSSVHKCAKIRPRRGVKRLHRRYTNLITGLARTARALPSSCSWTLSSLLRLRLTLRRLQIDIPRTTKAPAPSFNPSPTCSTSFLPSPTSTTTSSPFFSLPPATPSMSSCSPEPESGLLSEVTDNVVCGTTNGHIQELLKFKKNTQCATFIAVNRKIKNLCKDFQNKLCPYQSGHFSNLDHSYVDHYCQICYFISGGVCLDHSKLDCSFYKKKNLSKGKKRGNR